jgi:hypothetical protein
VAAGFELASRQPPPSGPLRVRFLNGEEEQAELDRQIAAVCQRYQIKQADLDGRLFAHSIRGLRIAAIIKSVPTIDGDAKQRMVDFITDNCIDVFMTDPLVA